MKLALLCKPLPVFQPGLFKRCGGRLFAFTHCNKAFLFIIHWCTTALLQFLHCHPMFLQHITFCQSKAPGPRKSFWEITVIEKATVSDKTLLHHFFPLISLNIKPACLN